MIEAATNQAGNVRELRYSRLQPHPEDPITQQTFTDLDQTILEVQQDLGINGRNPLDRSYAFSPAIAEQPGLYVSRNPHEVRVIDVRLHSKSESILYMIRDDAGRNSKVIAAYRKVYERRNDKSVKETVVKEIGEAEIVGLLQLVKERQAEGSFERKERRIMRLLAA